MTILYTKKKMVDYYRSKQESPPRAGLDIFVILYEIVNAIARV